MWPQVRQLFRRVCGHGSIGKGDDNSTIPDETHVDNIQGAHRYGFCLQVGALTNMPLLVDPQLKLLLSRAHREKTAQAYGIVTAGTELPVKLVRLVLHGPTPWVTFFQQPQHTPCCQ